MGNLYNKKSNHNSDRQKEIISRGADDLNRSMTEEYSKYFSSSPSYITYYQIDTLASTHDKNLENVVASLGENSAMRYKQIEMVSLYGVDPLDINTQIGDYGLSSGISGSGVLLPDTIKPQVGDRFVFDMDTFGDNLKEISFKVTGYSTSGITTKKFYKLDFSLDRATQEDLIKLVSPDKHFEIVQENVGTSKDSVMNKKDTVIIQEAHTLIDGLLTKYSDLFYDPTSDMFTCRSKTNSTAYVWCPYTHKFIHDQNLTRRYKLELLSGVYCVDISEREYPGIFSKKVYHDSLYTKIVLGSKNISPDVMNIRISEDNQSLKDCHNLPFMFTAYQHDLMQFGEESPMSFDAVYGSVSDAGCKLENPLDWDTENNIFPLAYDSMPQGKIMYFSLGGFKKEIFLFRKDHIDRLNTISRATRQLEWVSEDGTPLEDHAMENVLIWHLEGKLKLSVKLMDYLNESYYDDNYANYLLMPVCLYLLRKLCDDLEKPQIGTRH